MKKLATLFTRSLQEFKQVKTVTVCAMMGAVALVLGSLSVEIIPSVRIGFSGIPNEFVAWMFGPVVGPMFKGTMDTVSYTHLRTILEGIYEEVRPAAVDIFRRARLDPLNGAEGDIRRLCEGEGTIWMHLRAFFLREQGGHQIFYGAVSDVTEQRRREQKLEASQRALCLLYTSRCV